MAPRKSMSAGHAAHTQSALYGGLSGTMHRPIKLTFLGAGSFFAPRLVNDVVRIPGNRGGTIALVDIDEKRLSVTTRLIRKLLALLGATTWKVAASVDRCAVLPGTDYVVNCIEVSGLECVVHDNDIPLKYGVDQCIGDTIGPGGLFKALRTIPVWLEVLRDCERLCPSAWVLNYTNPMVMMCTAAARASSMSVVGLCHSVQGTSQLLAEYSNIPYDELEWECAGINHLAWFTRLEHQGKDLYASRLQAQFASEIAEGIREYDAGAVVHDSRDNSHGAHAEVAYRQRDLIRKDMCLHFGAFITESSGHLSEYLPYYRKSESGRKLLRLGYEGGSRFYATNWPKWRSHADQERRSMLRGDAGLTWERSWEYASWIIEAREKDAAFRIHGNVMNSQGGGGSLISNLPSSSCVEVACLVDRNGVHPTRYGALPPQMAAICASNLGMFDLGAQAAVERSVEKAIYALLLDPLTAATCTPAQIKAMTLELFAAEKPFLPGYR
ncbi:MAG: alpha-glucosidase/alpha-galactosidase [Opitutaceae bacterium]|nr:alpha-glucosidase/alpha-galactosidase [Opitutaceae bacterium]